MAKDYVRSCNMSGLGMWHYRKCKISLVRPTNMAEYMIHLPTYVTSHIVVKGLYCNKDIILFSEISVYLTAYLSTDRTKQYKLTNEMGHNIPR